MCCSFVLLLSRSLFLLCFEQALYLLQPWGRSLVALNNLQTLLLFSFVSSSTSAAGVASLCSSEVALFLFLVLSTSSLCTGAFRTPVSVRGEALGNFSSVSLNVTPPLIHKRVIKVGWGIFTEKLFLGQSKMEYSTIFPTFKLNPLTNAYKSMARSCLTVETCFEGVRTELMK